MRPRSSRRSSHIAGGTNAARHHRVEAPTLDLRQDDRLEGRHRRPPDQRRRRPAEEGQGQDRPWPGARSATARPSRSRPRPGSQVIRAETIVIATGSVPVELPFLPFGGTGHLLDRGAGADRGARRSSSVVGGGYIGLELGTAFAKLGAKVTVVEAQPRILPLYDAELTRPVAKRLAELGVEVLTGAKAKGLAARATRLLVETADGEETQHRRRQDPRHGRPQAGDARAGGSRSSISTWTAASSASTTSAAPRCAASMPSAT